MPRPNDTVRIMMRRMGVHDQLYTDILTSGEAVRRALANPPDLWWARLGRHVFHLGPERDRPILNDLAFCRVERPDQADFVLNTGPDDHLDPTDLVAFEPVLASCAHHRLPMICANPDLAVIRGGMRVLCAGALARRYQELGGDVRSLGKPDPAIYQHALIALDMPPERILAVGDSLRTDIAGATGVALAACWVLGGLHGAEVSSGDGSFDAARVEAAVAKAGLPLPVASVPRFAW
ncbi:MAG: TIGR01459 family HAD-type hydrolase [Acetobacteraceae bacterium]